MEVAGFLFLVEASVSLLVCLRLLCEMTFSQWGDEKAINLSYSLSSSSETHQMKTRPQ